MKVKKILAASVAVLACATITTGCGSNNNSTSSSGKTKITIISKSYQNQFYQAAFKGAKDAAAKYKVDLTTNGPDAESNVSQQVEQLGSAINQKPSAIALAACDPNAVQDNLAQAKSSGIPVIGFDSGVPGDKSGAVVATATTNNNKAGANVATNLVKNKDVQTKLEAGTAAKPAVVAILAQDSTSGSIVNRVDGFVKAAVEEISKLPNLDGAVSVSGQEKWTKNSAKPAKVKVVVTVPPTTSQADIQSAATSILGTQGLVSIFSANQDGVNALLSATNDGTELDKKTGKYKDIFVVGFDSGSSQRKALKAGEFLGSVTQDPYQMGYQAVALAVKAAKGEKVSNSDTGSHWYDSSNIDNPDIAKLLYD